MTRAPILLRSGSSHIKSILCIQKPDCSKMKEKKRNICTWARKMYKDETNNNCLFAKFISRKGEYDLYNE